jgi:hypothetical protein
MRKIGAGRDGKRRERQGTAKNAKSAKDGQNW